MTEDEREAIRAATDLGELVGADMELRRRGPGLWACCPFHEERTPSFVVEPDRGTFHCYGCGAHGDAFDYVMRTRGVSFREAAEDLARRAGIEITCGRHSGRLPDARLSAAIEAASARARLILADEARTDSHRARAWLSDHGIGPDAAERWGVGLAPGGRELCEALAEAGISDSEARMAGMCRAGRDALWRALCVPVHGPAGGALAICAQTAGRSPRTLVAGPRPAGQLPLLLMGEARASIRSGGTAIVTLGPLEAVLLHEKGIEGAVCSMGRGLGERHARALAAAGAARVVLAFPGGTAGARALRESLPAALAFDGAVTFVPVCGPDTLEALHRMGREGLLSLADGAEEAVAALLDDIADRHGTDDPNQLVGRAQEACDALRPAVKGDHARAAMVAEMVADRLGVTDPSSLQGPLERGSALGAPDPRSAADAREGGRPLVHREVPIARAGDGPADLSREASDALAASRGQDAGLTRAHLKPRLP